ncbi:serine/threonine-protein kinase [Nocardioides dubius]|uniref:non-specific serine/threonine protein kinase n=1 Tax=Nocardioides dubius TaxID=317019 RepID=A0ABP4EHQ4_9ACTN
MDSRVAGRYTLVREIGRGGMGAVWLARDEMLGRDVAIKRVAVQADGDAVARVTREARLAAMLNHPHVVTVFDLVAESEQRWLVMEYVESRNLSALIREQGPLTPDTAAPLLSQAASALAAAHQAGVVHRDVKPGNMLVTPTGLLKLGDFGIARTGTDVGLTQTGMVTGSPGYLAPEVAAGQSATLSSDVWSFGASVFHAVTGHPPYDTSENLMGALYRLVHEEPPRTEAAGWLAPLLLATMERDPARRWSADQVAAWLHDPQARERLNRRLPAAPARPTAAPVAPSAPVIATEPTDVLPTAPTRRRRSPVLLAVGVAALIALIAAGWVLGTQTSDDDAGSTDDAPPTSQTSTEPTTSAGPDAEGMRQFVASYLDQVTADPATAYQQMLTPAFQEKSGNWGRYQGWWNQVEGAELISVDADPLEMTVQYRVRYSMTNGKTRTEDISLDLAYDNGIYRIAGEG